MESEWKTWKIGAMYISRKVHLECAVIAFQWYRCHYGNYVIKANEISFLAIEHRRKIRIKIEIKLSRNHVLPRAMDVTIDEVTGFKSNT